MDSLGGSGGAGGGGGGKNIPVKDSLPPPTAVDTHHAVPRPLPGGHPDGMQVVGDQRPPGSIAAVVFIYFLSNYLT